jgi:thiol:disulfide interchange protein
MFRGLTLTVMRLRHCIFVVLMLLVTGVAARAASSSADVAHLHVQLVVPEKVLMAGTPTDAGLYFKLEPGWHIYWKNAGDSGEPPHIKWTLPEGITAGPLQFPAPKRLPLGPLMDFGYEDEVLFPFDFHVGPKVKTGEVKLQAKVDWLVCREVCIPGKADLETTRVVGGSAGGSFDQDMQLYDRLGDKLPKPLPATAKATFQPTATGFGLVIETGQREAEGTFFPADQDILDNPAPQKVTPTTSGLVMELKKDANMATAPAQLKGVIELSGGRSYEIAASEEKSFGVMSIESVPGGPAAAPAFALGALARTAGLAFLGGLLLNLMPCVFPVLFLKGLALVNSGNEERHKLRAHGFVYATGILVSFWALVGALLGLRAAGSTLGWGFQFQSPVFLALMAGLLFFLGLSLAGQFEIGLTLTSAGGSLAQKQGYTGSFFTGVLAVVVATPCTAPFMGAAVGYALSQSVAVTFAVFTALALGLAAPYVALTLQPAWTRLLPKPGAWMEVLKQAVAVPIFGTVIWLAWVLAGSYGAGSLLALLVSLLLVAIAGWFLGRWPAKRWATVVAAVILLSAAGLGIFEGINSGRVSPEFRSDHVLTLNLKMTPEELVKLRQSSLGTHWEDWSADEVALYRSHGTPVFVDFTAKWCLSCQVNEQVALTRPEVMKAFADAHVALLKADWTQHDDAIAQTLTALGRSGVPAYALYTPGQSEPVLLPEVLTPGIVTDALGKLPKTVTQANVSTSNLK